MTDSAFFFQGASLLVPDGVSLAAGHTEIPLTHVGGFPVPEVFTIPGGIADGSGVPSEAISCALIPPEALLPPHWQAIPVRQALAMLPGCLTGEPGPASRLLRAFHIAQWRHESMFCGSCGSKNIDTAFSSATLELARLCPACGRMEFPRIAPAVITLITNDEGQILLAHNKKFTSGVYSLIAGYVEAGESLEATVVRETREEVGIAISDVRYIASQPWPFPHSLMAGFSARYAAGTITPDGIEIEDAQWFNRNSLPQLPGPGSMAHYLIDRWLAGTLG